MNAVALRLPLTPYYPAPAKQAGAFCGGFSKSFAFVSRETSIPAPFGATFHMKRLCPPPFWSNVSRETLRAARGRCGGL